MAEDDKDLEDDDLDLGDDDLDLGDDSGDDSSDDFAGDLDEMMGDDELGGDSEAGGSDDSELDSFFEDLSSIEDMDEGGQEAEPESEVTEVAAPAAKEEKVKSKAAPAPAKESGPGKKRGKLIYVMLLFVLLLGGGGAYYYFFLGQEPELMTEEQIIPEKQLPKDEPIIVEKKSVKKILLEPELQPLPPMVKPQIPQRKYLVQVATCSYDDCKENYINSLREDGEPVFQKSSRDKYDSIELISRQVFSYREADSIRKEINRKNKMAGNASLKNQSNGYRISMGMFYALDRAKEIKFNIEKLFPKKNVNFNLEHVRINYSTVKIFAGPYESRVQAKKVLAELRKKKKYEGGFLVVF